MGQEEDRHGEQAGGQAVRAIDENLPESAATDLSMVKGHGQWLAWPNPFPKGQDDRDGE
jgi:hypothetical protein